MAERVGRHRMDNGRGGWTLAISEYSRQLEGRLRLDSDQTGTLTLRPVAPRLSSALLCFASTTIRLIFRRRLFFVGQLQPGRARPSPRNRPRYTGQRTLYRFEPVRIDSARKRTHSVQDRLGAALGGAPRRASLSSGYNVSRCWLCCRLFVITNVGNTS